TDKTLTCRDCGVTFLFTAGEQAFYAEKGFLNDPLRCSPCRNQRRRERVTKGKIMHSVTCGECGSEATVPFIPKNDKPVYCSACFDRFRPAPQVSLQGPRAGE
ncbi:MAG: zinc-ribbon domain containing protein, partial [Dehalococcoidia bacterium]|nr:zinc-ribbon domain containing protein [Dehalococcoidia bacterium]